MNFNISTAIVSQLESPGGILIEFCQKLVTFFPGRNGTHFYREVFFILLMLKCR